MHQVSPRSLEFAGVPLDAPALMGVVNATPDSFSDGGAFLDPDAAIARGKALVADGAAILDIGGESTRPGAEPVPLATELRRILPIVEGLRGAGVPLSIDTYKPEAMSAALDAGCTIVNDVSALRRGGASVVARRKPFVILGHMQGEPATMNEAPHYDDVVDAVHAFFAQRLSACQTAGLPPSRIALDPGLGFGKTRAHNIALLHALPRFAAFGCVLAVGASRKFARPDAAPEIKLATSVAAALLAAGNGARILRVHDVAATKAALALAYPNSPRPRQGSGVRSSPQHPLQESDQ